MRDDFVLSSTQYKELLQQLKDAEAYGKQADKELADLRAKLSTAEIERDEARAATDFANLACERKVTRLAEAWWIVENATRPGTGTFIKEWLDRRDAWLSGHTPTERVGKEAK